MKNTQSGIYTIKHDTSCIESKNFLSKITALVYQDKNKFFI